MYYPLQLFSIPRNTALSQHSYLFLSTSMFYMTVCYCHFFRDLATLFSNTFKVKGKFHQEYKLYQIDKKKVWLASMLPKLTRSYFKLLDMIHPLLVIYSEVIIRHLMLYACKKKPSRLR